MSICKVCFKDLDNEIYVNDLFNIKPHNICNNCYQKFQLIMNEYKIQNIKIFIAYRYNSFIKEIIYKYKGLYDIELKSIFIEIIIDELKNKYRGYTITFAPSFESEDRKRGYNHVEEMFSNWNTNKIKLFYKKENIKQSSQSKQLRKDIKKIIGINSNFIKEIKKLLIVDDIITTGNTLISCYNLAKKEGIKKVKLLALFSSINSCRNMSK